MMRSSAIPTLPDRTMTARDVALGVAKLASFPDVYFAVRRLLDDPDSALDDIAEALARDPALAAGVLRLANSAYFGLAAPVTTIERTVSMLGMLQTHDFVLATSVMNALPSIPSDLMDMRRFWRNSIIAATAARQLGDARQVLDSGRVFLLGLLAQLGQLALFLQLPQPCRAVLSAVDGNLLRLAECERESFGFDYADVGAELLAAWNLPAEIFTPIRQHTQPSAFRPVAPVVSMVHVAVQVALALDAGLPIEEIDREIDSAAWDCLELTTDQLTTSIEEIAQRYSPMSAITVTTSTR